MRIWKHLWKCLCVMVCLIGVTAVGASAEDLNAEDGERPPSSVVTQASVVKEDKTLNILAIGNSFTHDTMRYVSQIASSAGYDVTVGVLWKGSVSLATHVAYIQEDSPNYQYDLYTADSNGECATQYEVSASTAFQDREWDLVFLQQISHQSGIPSSFYDETGNSYLTTLTGLIRSKCSNPELSFTWLEGWAYARDYESDKYAAYYNNDQMTMYQAIADTTQNTVWASGEFETVIPVGTAVQNVRSSYIGDNLNRDGRHLTYSLGRYTAGLTVAQAIGIDVSEVTYYPQGSPNVSKLHLPMLREAVKAAVSTPFAVTQSSYTTTPSCAAPTLTESTSTDSGILLQWSQAEDATSYYIYRRAVGTETWERIDEVTSQVGKKKYSYTDSGIEEGGEYEYRVRAHFDSNLPNPSSKTAQVCWLKAPQLLDCQAGQESLTVQWAAYDKATQYKVRYATSASFAKSKTKTVSAAELQTTLDNLLADRDYYVQVCAQKQGTSCLYDGAWSDTMRAETPARLQLPDSVQCTGGKQSIQVRWNTVGRNGVCQIRYADNAEMEDAKKVTTESGDQVRTLTGLLADQTYYVQVRRRSTQNGDHYYSEWSETQICATEEWLLPLENVRYTVEGDSVTVRWDSSESATSYQIRYATREDMSNAKICSVSKKLQKKELTRLKSGKAYYVQVRARQKAANGVHYSEWSELCECDTGELKQVRGLSCKTGKTRLRIGWKAADGADRYQIRYSTRKSMRNAKTMTVHDEDKLSGTIRNLKKDKTYYVQVRARKIDGNVTYNGAWSTVKRCKTK